VDDYVSPPILIWDVLRSYGGIIRNGILCPFCSTNGESLYLRRSGIWTDGHPNTLYLPRVIYDSSSSVILVSAIYTCSNNHRVPSHNPSVISALPSYVYVPFYLTNRAGFTSDLISQISSFVDHGLSFLAIEDIIRDQYKQAYYRLRQRFQGDEQILGNRSVKEFPEFKQSFFPFPHDRIIRNIFTSYSSLFDRASLPR
jgi:hypothetical protein